MNPFMPYKDQLTEDQRQSATTQGWLGAASALANMSANRPGGQRASLLQLLTGGAQGFSSGADSYVNDLVSHYKPLEEMKQSQAMSSYLDSDPGRQYTQSLGMPEGMPVSPSTISTIASKGAEQNAQNMSDLRFKPQIAGATALAELPTKQTMASFQSGLDYNKSSRLDREGKALADYYDRQKPKEVAPGATLLAPDGKGSFAPVYTNPQSPLAIAQTAKAQQDVADTNNAKQESLISLEKTIRNGRALLNSKDLSSGVGMDAALGVIPVPAGWTKQLPATSSTDFNEMLDSFKSQNFLPAVAQLKGMGALSDAEGKKLEASVGALNSGMSEKAFKASLTQILDDLEAAKNRQTKRLQPAGWSIEKVQ